MTREEALHQVLKEMLGGVFPYMTGERLEEIIEESVQNKLQG